MVATVPSSNEHAGFHRWLRCAPMAVAAVSCVLVLVQVAWITFPPDRWPDPDYARGGLAIAAAACILPFHVHHIYGATTGSTPKRGAWTLTATAVVLLGVLPVIGAYWLPVMFVLTVSALIVVRRPWSLLIAAATVVAPAPLGLVMGATPFYAFWYPQAVVFRALVIVALLWLAGAALRLQTARVALAERAVAVERLRIDDEIQRRMGAALESIAERGRAALTAPDDTDLDSRLRDLVGDARTAADDVSRLAGTYRRSSARADLDTAAALLTAAGVRTRVEIAGGRLPPTLDADARRALRSATVRILDGASVGCCVIAVTVTDGSVRLEVSSDTRAGAGTAEP